MSFAELNAQHTMYLTVFERIHAMLIKALAVDEVLAAKPTAEFDAKFGDPTQFVTLAFAEHLGHTCGTRMTRGCATSLSARRAAAACAVALALAGCGGAPSPEDLRAETGERWPFVEQLLLRVPQRHRSHGRHRLRRA